MASSDKDLRLKLKVSALMRQMGYAVFQEVNLSAFSYQPKYARKQVTDFDVLAVLVEPDFSVLVSVAECKSAEAQAMEYLLKLNGLREFFKAGKAYLVQTRIDINAREIGRELGIWCLDEHNLATLMSGVGVESFHIDLEAQVYTERERLLKLQKEHFPKATDYLRYHFWTLPEHRNIINLMRHANLISDQLNPKDPAHINLAHQIATNLALAVLQVAGQIARHNINDVENGALNRIFGGSRERRDREVLFDTVSKLLPDQRLSPVPDFMPALVELIARLINASRAASVVLPCLDHLTRRLLVARYDSLIGTPEQVYGSRSLKLARDVLYFLINAAKVKREIFAASLNDAPSNGIEVLSERPSRSTENA